MNIPQHIIIILQKRLEQELLTDQERFDLEQWYRSESTENMILGEANWEQELLAYIKVNANQQKKTREFERFKATVGGFAASSATASNKPIASSAGHRLYFLRKWSWAAAIIILVGVVAYLFTTTKGAEEPIASQQKLSQSAIQPGTNKAVLIVDHTKIDLVSDKTGITVGKTISYTDGEKLSDAGSMIMLTTPNGGQYQLILPDGTKAWLNTSSSISFSSEFTGENRTVKVSGEVYLEVAKDKVRPFLVEIAGQSIVEVLGTSFNINSYADEGEVTVTLVEGSVRVGEIRPAYKRNSVMLEPGQQAVIELATVAANDQNYTNKPSIIVKSNANMEQALAWKQGLFNFSNIDLRAAMKQLERWYDIKVRYEGDIPDIPLDGEMYRNVLLSDILETFGKAGLKFRMDGKTLIVHN